MFTYRRGATLVALVAVLGACSEGNGPSGSGNTLDDAQASALGADVAYDAAELIETSIYDPSSGVTFTPVMAGARLLQPPACVTVSPLPVVNSDADLIPDSLRFTYDDCTFTRHQGNLIDSLSGAIDFVDPVPAAVSLGVRHRFLDFTRSRTNVAFPARSWRAEWNGVREWGGDADTLGHTVTGLVTERTFPGGRTTTHTKDWIARFTATTPGTIAFGSPLPAGSVTLGGTSTWTGTLRSWSVVTTTVTPLAYDPACTDEPRFTAGELALVVTRNGEVSNVTIEFTGCGAVTITRVPGATS